MKYMCPVCGFDMDDTPDDYNICPCCGTEFGLHDHNASYEQLRTAWLRTGPRWWSKTDTAPENWNPYTQLARFQPTTGTSTVVIADRADKEGTEK